MKKSVKESSARRAPGEGSVYKRKDGRWCGQYTVELSDGTMKKKCVYARTRGELAKKLRGALAERDAGLVHDDGRLTLGEYLDRWLASTKDTVRIGTWKQYEMLVRLHLKPGLGGVRLCRLNEMQVQAFYRAKLDSGASARRVQYAHVTLHKALKDAVRWRVTPRNVAASVTPPRPAKREIKPLTREQVSTLLSAAEGERLYPLYVLAVTTGMRSGELLGLQWRDMDLEAGTLTVRRTVFCGVVSPPKTSAGRRTIRLSRLAVRVLGAHEREGDWVFCSSTGTSLDVHNFRKKSWLPLLKRAGLPKPTRFHDIRHTAATLLLMRGVPVKVVSEMLGHSDPTITLSIYAHVLPDMQGATARAMDLMLGADEHPIA